MTVLYICKICYRTFSFNRTLEVDDLLLLYSHLWHEHDFRMDFERFVVTDFYEIAYTPWWIDVQVKFRKLLRSTIKSSFRVGLCVPYSCIRRIDNSGKKNELVLLCQNTPHKPRRYQNRIFLQMRKQLNGRHAYTPSQIDKIGSNLGHRNAASLSTGTLQNKQLYP